MTKAVEKKLIFQRNTFFLFPPSALSHLHVYLRRLMILFKYYSLFCYCFRKRKYQNEDICLCRDLFEDKSRDEGKLLIQLLMHPHIFAESFCILRYGFVCTKLDVPRDEAAARASLTTLTFRRRVHRWNYLWKILFIFEHALGTAMLSSSTTSSLSWNHPI